MHTPNLRSSLWGPRQTIKRAWVSSVSYAKSTRLPQINPVAENLRTVRLTMSHLLIDIRRKTEYVSLFLNN